MSKKISRRQLLKTLAAATGLTGLCKVLGIPLKQGKAWELEEHAYLALVTKSGPDTPTPTSTATPTSTPTSPPTGSPVVHVHAADATSWDFSTGWYGDYVNQSVVNEMVDEGLRQLTGEATVAAAWQVLLPGYAPGKAIAVKVNFNNSSCADSDNIIDALIEPVNALVRGMKELGVQEEDVWVYDASRCVPDRFRTRCLYPNIRFFEGGYTICGDDRATFNSNDPTSEINFGHPNLTTRRITDAVINATYLINMPILKDHGIPGVTLGFKNHFGTIDDIKGSGDDNLHYYIKPDDPLYSPSRNPLLDIYLNPHIRYKTVLTVGDGLYGKVGTSTTPQRWSTFLDDAPNSLFFAMDPVAIDCVMFDILDAEPIYHPRWDGLEDDYLELAAGAGLGVYERGDPWGSGYSRIDYLKIDA